ncbi:MAG: hypothetical protein SFX19_06990, partial [Alphaproteobacteria bacterium]|nr:hypothetical protein [Alphaproteobacteria bacterium]
DLKSLVRKNVPVRVRPRAPLKKPPLGGFFSGIGHSDKNQRFGIFSVEKIDGVAARRARSQQEQRQSGREHHFGSSCL